MGSFPTEIKVLEDSGNLSTIKTDVLIIPFLQQAEPSSAAKTKAGTKAKKQGDQTLGLKWAAVHKAVDKAMNGHLRETLEAEKFKADAGKKRIFKVRSSDKLQARWVVVVGLGDPEKLDMKKATHAFRVGLKDTFGFEKVYQATLCLQEGTKKITLTQLVQTAVFGAIQSTYKTQEAGEKKVHPLKTLSLILPKGQGKTLNQDAQSARVYALAESFTKDLANMPANLKTAESLAQAARSMADIAGVTVEVVSDLKKLQKQMPAFWAVAQGAAKADPPRFIKVTYKAPGTKKIQKQIALVGKGVIFDTGGVQVKTGNSMNDMKFDMTGAATVLSVIRAAAELKLKGIEVSAYVAATRNLTGEDAYLPDSIIDSASGKKIEIRHTDAEGRVTLADAVYKATQDKPDEIVTIATLTGSAGIAVGHCIALMGSEDDLVNRIEKTAKAMGEPVQKLAFFDEDFDSIKSDRDAADLSNTSKNRNRGHMSAGAFVVSFAQDIPIAHLDIAGGDAKDGNATGIAVKGLIEYLRKEAS